MSFQKKSILMVLAMTAFAGNSVLCRLALKDNSIDALSFTTIRIVSGALFLWLLVYLLQQQTHSRGNWFSSTALFIYAAGFSIAYVTLDTGVGALLLFSAVQITMIGYGLCKKERLEKVQWLGFFLTVIGVVILLLPGVSAPSLTGAIVMLTAGVAWGIYSLMGQSVSNPMIATASNFMRAIPLVLVTNLVFLDKMTLAYDGIIYAALSGALASGAGYAIWYTLLPHIKSIQAAFAQLSVPVIAAAGGVIFLAEPLTWRLLLSTLIVLTGLSIIVFYKHKI